MAIISRCYSFGSYFLLAVNKNRNVMFSVCVSELLWEIETNHDIRVIQDDNYNILSKLTIVSCVTLIEHSWCGAQSSELTWVSMWYNCNSGLLERGQF